jgi:hypothetical protein
LFLLRSFLSPILRNARTICKILLNDCFRSLCLLLNQISTAFHFSDCTL